MSAEEQSNDARDDVRLDLSRQERTGVPEAVFAEPKSAEQLCRIIDQASSHDTEARLLFTRLSTDQLATLPDDYRNRLDHDPESRTAVLGRRTQPVGRAQVAVVAAGTSDRPIAAEAEQTLAHAGLPALSITDVGVAGLWRLLERVKELEDLDVVIVVAGMEGALPTVVAGLVPGLVVAVPSSVGYGVAEGGHVALQTSLASCAPGVVVVNIDNGYGAAVAAIKVIRRIG